MKKYVCALCGYEYNARKGDVENGVEPGTDFEEISEDWVCPLCGAGKEDFEEDGEFDEDDENYY